MEAVRSKTLIELPLAQCWARMRDLTLAHNYVPGVLRTELTTEKTEGVGASRKVFLKDDPDGMDETVIDWTEGRGFLLRLH